ncbi:hypothetical protein T09_11163 [Trichinella sp. T9]|nr:hypothetical protein T09_11163 [Trichinella sp. T9]
MNHQPREELRDGTRTMAALADVTLTEAGLVMIDF